MRFRVRVEVTVEAGSLEQAQAIAGEVEHAAFDAAAAHVAPAPPDGALSRTELQAADDDAAGALAAEGLGPGISSARHRAG